MKLLAVVFLLVALCEAQTTGKGTELACIFQTNIMEEVNTEFVRILKSDHQRFAAEIIEQAAGSLNLKPLKFTHSEQLQASILVYWEAEEFDIDEMNQALSQIMLNGPPYTLSGIGPFGNSAVAVPQVCESWETRVEDRGGFTIASRSSRRQAVIEQKIPEIKNDTATEIACIFVTNAVVEANTIHLPTLENDYLELSNMVAKQAPGALPLQRLLKYSSVDQLQSGILIYWTSMLDLETLAMAADQLLLNPKPYVMPGYGPFLGDALAQPQVCSWWLSSIENVNFFITTRANIRGTLLPPTRPPHSDL